MKTISVHRTVATNASAKLRRQVEPFPLDDLDRKLEYEELAQDQAAMVRIPLLSPGASIARAAVTRCGMPFMTLKHGQNGELTERTILAPDGMTHISTFFGAPGWRGMVSVETEYAADGKTPRSTTFKDSLRECIEEFAADGKTIKARTTRGESYDSVTRFAADGKTVLESEHTEKDRYRTKSFYQDGIPVSLTVFAADGKTTFKSDYDHEDGSVTKTSFKDGRPALTAIYDKNNRLVISWLFHENGKMQSETIYRTDGPKQSTHYDKNGARQD